MSSKALNDSYVSVEFGAVTHRSAAVPVVRHGRERVAQCGRWAHAPHASARRTRVSAEQL